MKAATNACCGSTSFDRGKSPGACSSSAPECALVSSSFPSIIQGAGFDL